MADLADLEARIRRLEDIEATKADIEAIKRVKYKYFRCLDSKLWDELAECFTEDATTDYRSGTWAFQGVDAIVQFLKKLRPTRLSVHQGHHPEIELTSDTTANGIWSFNDYVIDKQTGITLRGAGFYYDEYVKVNGEWKIKLTGYTRTFEEIWDRGETKSLKLTADRFPSSE
jgi:hypothetical protein